MNEVTKDVILDLLPLYIADEVSEDTRVLIDTYLETDPDLSQIAKKLMSNNLLGEAPQPIRKDSNMKAYSEAKKAMVVQTIIIAAAIAIVLLTFAGLLAMFLIPA